MNKLAKDFIKRDVGGFKAAINAVLMEMSNEVDAALDGSRIPDEVLYNGFMRKGLLSMRHRLAEYIEQVKAEIETEEETNHGV